MAELPDGKPSSNEEEYFRKRDAELVKAWRAKLDAERAEQARTTARLKCPKCGGDLEERDMHDVKVDVCTQCSGVWLDAGELELLRQTERGGAGRFFADLFRTARK